VHAHDLVELRSAVEAALQNPISSWIPTYMEFDYIVERMGEVVENDWRVVAAEILEERRMSGVGEVRLFAAGDASS